MATDDCGCSSETLLALSETVRIEFKKIRDDPSDIKALLGHEPSRAISLILQPLQRASTKDELGESIIKVTDVASLGRKISGVSLRATIRNFVRLFMTKNLAMQFSWSGLAMKRQATKFSFKDHEIYELLQKTLKETSYASCSTLEVSGAVKCVLHGASDWDNGRKKREKNVEAESQKSSDEEVEREMESDNNDD